MYLKKQLSNVRPGEHHGTEGQPDMQVNTKPFLTEAELAATIGGTPGNFIETTKEVEQGNHQLNSYSTTTSTNTCLFPGVDSITYHMQDPAWTKFDHQV